MTIKPEELAEAERLYLGGSSTHEIGRILGYSGAGVFKALIRVGVPMRSKKQAIRLTYTHGRVRGPAIVNNMWTLERIGMLRKLLAEGLSCTLIAERLSLTGERLTKDAVIGKIRRMGLSPWNGDDVSRRRAAINGGKAAARYFEMRRAATNSRLLLTPIITFPTHLQQQFDECLAYVRRVRPRIWTVT